MWTSHTLAKIAQHCNNKALFLHLYIPTDNATVSKFAVTFPL